MWCQQLLGGVLFLTCVFAQSPVKVTVYYETLCSDSVAFITNQLKPAFDAVGPTRMAVDFVPYGKATHTAGPNGWVFRNQHGHAEYQGNKMHACAIAALKGNAAGTVNFVACGMRSPNGASDTGRECFAGIPQDVKARIQQCNDGVEGDTLLASHGDRTHALVPKMSLSPNMGFVPRVEINGVYNVNEEHQANSNLKGLVCTKLQGTPLQCSSQRSIPQEYQTPYGYPQIPEGYPSSSPQPYPTLPGPPAHNPYPSYPSSSPQPYPTLPGPPAHNPYPSYPSSSPQPYPTLSGPTAHNPYPSYPGYPSYNPYPTYQPQNNYPGYPGYYPNQYPGYPGSYTTQRSYNPYPTYPSYPGYGGYPSPSPQPQPQPHPQPLPEP